MSSDNLDYWSLPETKNYFMNKGPNELMLEWLAKRGLPASGCRRLLDAGCGYGRNISPFAGTCPEVFCFDPCRDAIEYTQSRYGLPEQNARCASLEEFPWDGLGFDLILCDGVLHQLGSRAMLTKTIRYFNRSLECDGFLFVSLFTNRVPPDAFHDRGDNIWENGNGLRMSLFPDQELQDLFLQNGFFILESKSEVFQLDVGRRANLSLCLTKNKEAK